MRLISIILPIYNSEKYLRECLDSLIYQTYRNIEIICINDGSTDNSSKILEEYVQRDNRIKIINQKNLGVSVARNVGIDKAKGDYIMFVDSDDWLELNTCQKINSVASLDIDIIFYNYNINLWIGSTAATKYKNFIIKNKKIKFYEYIEECFSDLNLRGIVGKVYKRNFIKQYNVKYNKDLWWGEDTYFLMNILIKNPQVYILEDCLYNYRILSVNSLSKKACEKQYKQLLLLLYYYNQLFVQSPNKLLEFCANNDTFNALLYLFRDIYFTKYKMEYLLSLNSVYEKLKNYNIITKEYKRNIKIYKINMFLTEFHFVWLYWKIIFPLEKYCIVLPYRIIKNLLRSKNG